LYANNFGGMELKRNYASKNAMNTILLANRLIDGGEVVSLERRPCFTPRKIFLYSFLLEAELTPRQQD
jgi:hypothetical protein